MGHDTTFRSFYDLVLLKSFARAAKNLNLHWRRIYFEAIDLMMNAIDQRFEQPSFDTYAKMESLLIKSLNSQDKSEELNFMEKLYNDDVNISMLTGQMEILQVLLKDDDYYCFDDIMVKIKELPNPDGK